MYHAFNTFFIIYSSFYQRSLEIVDVPVFQKQRRVMVCMSINQRTLKRNVTLHRLCSGGHRWNRRRYINSIYFDKTLAGADTMTMQVPGWHSSYTKPISPTSTPTRWQFPSRTWSWRKLVSGRAPSTNIRPCSDQWRSIQPCRGDGRTGICQHRRDDEEIYI